MIGFLGPLLDKLFVTIKAINSSADKCLRALTQSCHDPALLPCLHDRLSKDVHFQCRKACIALADVLVKSCDQAELTPHMSDVEAILRVGVADVHVEARAATKAMFASLSVSFFSHPAWKCCH